MDPKDFQTYREALEMGLYLAVIAPTEEQMREAVDMARVIAACMTPEEVEAAKATVEERLEEEKREADDCTLAFRMDRAGRIAFIKRVK
jgi:enoyl-CoA hydratase/carnithine racemase